MIDQTCSLQYPSYHMLSAPVSQSFLSFVEDDLFILIIAIDLIYKLRPHRQDRA